MVVLNKNLNERRTDRSFGNALTLDKEIALFEKKIDLCFSDEFKKYLKDQGFMREGEVDNALFHFGSLSWMESALEFSVYYEEEYAFIPIAENFMSGIFFLIEVTKQPSKNSRIAILHNGFKIIEESLDSFFYRYNNNIEKAFSEWV